MLPLAPDPTNDPCDTISGPSGEYCRGGSDGSGSDGGGGGVADTLDPLASLAKSVAKAADWTAQKLGEFVGDRQAVDFTDSGFLKQYAVIFAASSILVLVVWLFAVAKRAIRGVPMLTAMSEALGLLWLAVAATAFTPLILYTLVGAVGAVTDGLVAGLGTEPGGVFKALGEALKQGKIGGGPIVLIAVSLLTILLCGVQFLLLVLRALTLYVGAILGVVVYSGLVDKDLWGHVRRWASFMLMVVLIEPVIVIAHGLSVAVQTSDDGNPIVAGLAVSLLALGASVFMLFKFPGFGDSIKVARAVGRTGANATNAVIGGGASPAAGVARGIQTHAARGGDSSSSNAGRTNGTPRPSNPVSGGISAHSNRSPVQKPKKKSD